ncbi:MAG TPA: leucyl aminopeptidase [Spongiibacteraceae bacterium]|jgi:leucyl aminopeptidase|nr:leucyl aminopeptidase [Spongiibacteraceae bacterium]HUH37225.1 leucyl aminopeptidase [Spongiibacteraceae bacterium]
MNFSLQLLTNHATLTSDCIVLTVATDHKLDSAAKAIDKACGGVLQQTLDAGDFAAKPGDAMLLPATGCQAKRLLLLGTGEPGALSPQNYLKLVEALFRELGRTKAKTAHLLGSALEVEARDCAWQLQQLAQAAVTASYRYTRTLSKPREAGSLRKLVVDGKPGASSKRALAQGVAIGQGINAARELGNLPGNVCTPSYLANQARALGRKHAKLKVSVLDEKKMRELKMGALLSVTAGSAQPARLIVMEYRGGKTGEAPQVLVGKGITFDSGGISIKPGAKMDEMKFDMCGAASVLGTMEAVLALELPINVVGVIAASENLPSGTATKPGDVVTSMSGQTIEILNTDAEGRLVLCDTLTYVARFKPDTVIDIATLTGACVVALGSHASGLYSNQQDLADQLLAAGQQSGDRAWQMPLWEDYQKQLDSNFADMGNVGGPEAGSITAACFLARYTKDYRWAHLDIAGTAWLGGTAKGATGRPVGLLMQYLLDRSGA